MLIKEFEEKAPPHPGELIVTRLGELHMTQAECAKRMGITAKHLNQICKQYVDKISPELALKFEYVLALPMRVFLAASADYRTYYFRKKLQEEEELPCEIEDTP